MLRYLSKGISMLKTFACAALFATALAQNQVNAQGQAADKTVTKQNAVTATATIRAIDQKTRSVTLRNENGDEDTFTVGPEVKRFNELKVGDRIRATYYESLVFELRKPGNASTPTGTTLAGGRLKETPGGAVGAQQTMTVTVKAVDMNAPSITVVTPDNRTLTRKVENKKNLEGVSPGDRIDITYTQALMVNAEPAK
jgi:Cu/Ag efflux protein CusF